jgi:hypothetical protein
VLPQDYPASTGDVHKILEVIRFTVRNGIRILKTKN